jgi:hypothetical protein
VIGAVSAVVIATVGLSVGPAAPANAAGTSYYIDCGATGTGSGTEAAPWTQLATVASKTFVPGDRVLLKRGSTCQGALRFSGSGSAVAPIVVGSYGTGAKPLIKGNGTVPEAVRLANQEYVHLTDLEVTNKGATAANRRGCM